MVNEMELVEICQEIGNIAGSNSHYTMGLARLMHDKNICLIDMRIGELILLSREYKETFNRIHGMS